MKAHFTFLESLGEKLVAVGALVTMVFVVYPETVGAAQAANQQGKPEALVFQIDSNQNQSISEDQNYENDPVVMQVVAYIKQKAPKSPLANPKTVAHMLSHTGVTEDRAVWMRALGISFVESQMCTYTPKPRGIESHNCSGIVAGNGYKMYASYEDWFTDMTKLLQKPNYVNRPLKAYLRYYVQPGSYSWLNGVTRVESDLVTIHTKGLEDRVALTQNTPVVASSLKVELAQ